jgi:CubicO group peptidase (beta-lactamase class C family)
MKRLLLSFTTSLSLWLATGLAGAAPPDVAESSPAPASASASASVVEGSPAHELAKADLDAWLDGYMPYALAQADIAGAVVVVVKDGRVLTQRGFGYADIGQRRRVDPENTLFRIGSISKVFTWTAVMQLQEQGRIDLDADINLYLDFKIPPYEGRPLTMRQLMTHTAGFEEAVKGGITFSGTVPSLGDAVKTLEPARVFAPGSTPAYSNYGAALAGYIVERVSGMSYEDYVRQHIFQPLGMSRSSTLQSLPPALADLVSRGYERASAGAKPFELVSVSPAGGLSISGADMAKFMEAQLAQGHGLMDPKTAALMQAPSTQGFLPGVNRMALGLYQQRMNDLHAIAHGGDLRLFHSYMWLVPETQLGIFVSLNSAGADESNWTIRQALFEQFADRYYPARDTSLPVELPTAREHARQLAGSYVSQRAWFTSFMDALNLLQQVRIELDADGRPLIPDPFGGPPAKWIETAPYVWQDAYGHQRIGAAVENGQVVRWSMDSVSPFMVWDRSPWYRDAAWLLPSAVAALGVIVLTALSWPIGALTRRRFKAALTLTGSGLLAHRLVKSSTWLTTVAILGWAALFAAADPLAAGTLDWAIWPIEVLSVLAVVGLACATAFRLWHSFATSEGAFAKVFAVIFAISSVLVAWVMLAFHLASFGVKY